MIIRSNKWADIKDKQDLILALKEQKEDLLTIIKVDKIYIRWFHAILDAIKIIESDEVKYE